MRKNPFERIGRLEKVSKLEQVLRLGKITAELASRMTEEDWFTAAIAARICKCDTPSERKKKPSPETQQAVIASMRRFEELSR